MIVTHMQLRLCTTTLVLLHTGVTLFCPVHAEQQDIIFFS
jgi:hypothetical protein